MPDIDIKDPVVITGKFPLIKKRPSTRFTTHWAADKEEQAKEIAATPMRAIAKNIGFKGCGLAILLYAHNMWKIADSANNKLLSINPLASPSHFNQYVAISLAIIGFYLVFPDIATALFKTIKLLLPWGKK